ncbi:MAG: DUF2147 domain-containing protein [Cryomorphaceae bacterium]|nr:MAG: DUF2147 domain-containing protein [Cryomorphaceae bacterium]
MGLGQSGIFGHWKTYDDKSGYARSIVEITKRDGKAYGVIQEVFLQPDEPENPLCIECEDHRKDQPILGMEVITGLEKNGDTWEGGEILDPESGRTYRCKIWLEDGKLKVRGYLAFLYRTQTWIRVD